MELGPECPGPKPAQKIDPIRIKRDQTKSAEFQAWPKRSQISEFLKFRNQKGKFVPFHRIGL